MITSLFTECSCPFRMATKLADASKSVAALAVWTTGFGAVDAVSTGFTCLIYKISMEFYAIVRIISFIVSQKTDFTIIYNVNFII